MGTILLVILIVLLIGAIPTWPYSSGWGYFPSGGLGLLVLPGCPARPRRCAPLGAHSRFQCRAPRTRGAASPRSSCSPPRAAGGTPARRVQLDDEPGPSAFIALVGRRERAPGASPRRLLPAIAYPSDARRYDSFRRRRTAPGTPAVRLRLLLGTRYWATSAALMMAAAF